MRRRSNTSGTETSRRGRAPRRSPSPDLDATNRTSHPASENVHDDRDDRAPADDPAGDRRRVLRRPRHRRRTLRCRRRLPSPDHLPAEDVRHPRGPRPHGRHVGPLQVSRASARTPTCIRSATRSSRGSRTSRSPTARRSSSTSATRPSQHDIDRKIRYGHKLISASWSTSDARWTVELDRGGESVKMQCNFLYMCTGYYDYDKGFTPEFPGMGEYGGQVVHPQLWPENLDYAGKRIVVIGSGATAVTLLPSLAEKAEHVTMLQRSPTYIVALPAKDPVATWAAKRLPVSARVSRGALEPAVLLDPELPAQPQVPELHEEADHEEGPRGAARGLQDRPALHAVVQPVGPAHLPRSRRRSLQGDQRRATRRSPPARSRRSRSPASRSSRARRSKPTSSSRRPASISSSSAA